MTRDDGADRDLHRAAAALEIDPERSTIVSCIGTKGSGKSEAARVIFDNWPYDRIVVDVTGNARPDDPAHLVIPAPVPSQLPEPAEGQTRITAWVRLDPRRENHLKDQDDALGLALYPRDKNRLILIDEYGLLAPSPTIGRDQPNLKTALYSSRHYHTSIIMCFPRPKYVPRLTLAQSDLVFIFRVPNREDREVIAENIGFDKREFEIAYAANQARAKHAYLLWDSRQTVLIDCPPLPLSRTHGPRA